MNTVSLIQVGKGLAVAALMAVMGIAATNYASAQPNSDQPSEVGYAKEQCMDGGWETMGFKNQGQCMAFYVSESDN